MALVSQLMFLIPSRHEQVMAGRAEPVAFLVLAQDQTQVNKEPHFEP
jgi:hypothetical protein